MPFDWKGFYLYRFRLPKIGELSPQATEGLFYSCPGCLYKFPINTRAARAAHLPDSPDTPEIPDIPDSKYFSLQFS